ncbi:TPA: hypothetical protein ACX6SL_001321 [Photobacterium damselae]
MSNTGTYSRKTVDVTEVHSNIEQRLIQITEDKLKLVLNEHLEYVEQKRSWIAPLGILFTLLVVFATTDFKDAYLNKDTWRAIFIISTILTSGWLIRAMYFSFKAQSVTDVINKIKQGNS